jgi:hypothetical protein
MQNVADIFGTLIKSNSDIHVASQKQDRELLTQPTTRLLQPELKMTNQPGLINEYTKDDVLMRVTELN